MVSTSFQRWPDGDPGELRALGEQWTQLSGAIFDAYSEMDADVSQVAVNWGGDAGKAFIARWQAFVGSDAGGPNAFMAAANEYAMASQETALNLEYAQLMATIIVAITAAEIILGIAFSEFGGLAFAAAATAAGRVALIKVLQGLSTQMAKQVLKTAVKDAAKLVAEKGGQKIVLRKVATSGLRAGGTFLAADFGAQGIQNLQGNRDGFDVKLLTSSFVGGTAAGLTGYLLGVPLGNALGRNISGKFIKPLTREGAEKLLTLRNGLVRLGEKTLAQGLINIPSVAVMTLSQELTAGHSLSEALGNTWKMASDPETILLGFAGAAGRHVFETNARGAVAGTERLLGADRTGHQITGWHARAEAISAGRETALADLAAAKAEATGLRQLEVAALARANDLPPGPARTAALHQAESYGKAADLADITAATSQAHVTERTAALVTSDQHLAGLEGQHAAAARPSEVTSTPDPVRLVRAESAPEGSPRLPDSVSTPLAQIHASHDNYVRAEGAADRSQHQLRDVQQARATEQALDLSRQHGLKPPAQVTTQILDGPAGRPHDPTAGLDAESLTQHGMIWHDLATGERSSVVRQVNDLLNRPDLPSDTRSDLTRMRDAYRSEGDARIARADHEQRAEELGDQAWGHARNGHTEDAAAAVRASATEMASAERDRSAGHRALIGADAAMRDLASGIPATLSDGAPPAPASA